MSDAVPEQVPEQVWVTFHGKDSFAYADIAWAPAYEHAKPYRIYPEAEAAALLDVARLAREPRGGRIRMQAALERLDAARAAS